MKTPRDLPLAAKQRLADWLGSMKDSPAKTLAKRVADVWDAEGEAAAVELFRSECEAQKMVRWVQVAVSDMATAFRATRDMQP